MIILAFGRIAVRGVGGLLPSLLRGRRSFLERHVAVGGEVFPFFSGSVRPADADGGDAFGGA